MRGATVVKRILAAVPLCVLAACSGLAPAGRAVPPPSAETVSGQALGAQAAAMISGAAPVEFAALTFDGPVSAVSREAVLGALAGTRALATPRGTLTIRYDPAARAGASPSPAGSGTRACLWSRVAASGSYEVTGGTGGFAGATGRGVYSLTFTTETKRSADGACSPSGVPVPAGAQADFTASGPLS